MTITRRTLLGLLAALPFVKVPAASGGEQGSKALLQPVPVPPEPAVLSTGTYLGSDGKVYASCVINVPDHATLVTELVCRPKPHGHRSNSHVQWTLLAQFAPPTETPVVWRATRIDMGVPGEEYELRVRWWRGADHADSASVCVSTMGVPWTRGTAPTGTLANGTPLYSTGAPT